MAEPHGHGHHTVVTRVASLCLVLLAAAAVAGSATARESALPGLMTSKPPWSADNRALLHARLDKGRCQARVQGTHSHPHMRHCGLAAWLHDTLSAGLSIPFCYETMIP